MKPHPPWRNSLNTLGEYAYVSELPSQPKLDHYYWVIGGNAYQYSKDGWLVVNKAWFAATHAVYFAVNKDSYKTL